MKDKEKYKFELEHLVCHRHIANTHINKMSNEFTKVLRDQDWIFDVRDTGSMIEGVAANIEENSLFSIGISALYSSAYPEICIKCLNILNDKNIGRIDFKLSIKKYLAYANLNFSRKIFALQPSTDYIVRAIKHAEKAVGFKNNLYEPYMFLSYLYYRNNDLNKAQQATKDAEKYQVNIAWKFNKTFLYLYSGDLSDIKEGVKIYKSIKQKQLREYNSQFYSPIKATILDAISEDKKNQYYYSIVFVFAKCQNDYDQANDYFQMFIETVGDDPNFEFLISEAKEILLSRPKN